MQSHHHLKSEPDSGQTHFSVEQPQLDRQQDAQEPNQLPELNSSKLQANPQSQPDRPLNPQQLQLFTQQNESHLNPCMNDISSHDENARGVNSIYIIRWSGDIITREPTRVLEHMAPVLLE